MSRVSMDQVNATYKQRDAWWTVLLVDPLAGRLLRVVGGASWITPTRLTVTAFLVGLAAAGAFWQATAWWLVLGAVLYYASFVIDCVDGKLARLRGTGSIVGSWLDFLLDRIRVFIATLALCGGQFRHTDDVAFLVLATGIAFLALFGYLNGAETDKAKARMATGTVSPDGRGRSGDHALLRAPAVARVRGFLHRHRIRMNLVSGVEFEMAVFVVAPLIAAATGAVAIIWTTAVAAVLLLCFELALIARFVISARSFDAQLASRPLPTPRLGARSADDRLHHPA